MLPFTIPNNIRCDTTVSWPHNQQFRLTEKTLEAAHTKSNDVKRQKSALLDELAEIDFGVSILADDVDVDAVPSGSQSSQSSSAPLLDGQLALPPPMARSPAPMSRSPAPLPPMPSPAKAPIVVKPPATPTQTAPMHGPQTLPKKDERMDAAYDSQMSALISNIHKTNNDWNKKAREYQIFSSRLQQMPMCANSEVLKSLVADLETGRDLDNKLRAIEEKYALDVYIETSEQTMAKYHMNQIMNCLKEMGKTKFLYVCRWSRHVDLGLKVRLLPRKFFVFVPFSLVQLLHPVASLGHSSEGFSESTANSKRC